MEVTLSCLRGPGRPTECGLLGFGEQRPQPKFTIVWRELLERIGAPTAWTGWFAENQRDVDEIAAGLRAAGLGPVDVWMERRRRCTDPDAFMARIRSVAGHLLGNPPGGFSELDQRIDAALHAESAPDGFVYDYCKLFALARRPLG